MKKYLFIAFLPLLSEIMMAGITTYQFTSISWASQMGATQCDGKTDGWVSHKDASDYSKGYVDAQGIPYCKGVSVKTGTSGAGATSVKSFTNIRRITFNFCQNKSKGKGCIYVQVGNNPYDSIIIRKPAVSGSGEYLRDSAIYLTTPYSGKIKFWITCSENAINLNSISIRAEEGGSTPFTTASYQLVTNSNQLRDSDQIIIGVQQTGVDYIMGYFDEEVSKNNIHAIKGQYGDNRQTVGGKDEAIYTLRKGQTSKSIAAWYIQDELRYELAYLVASGGQTKNRLALWTHLYDEKSYGDYGYWDIQVADDGRATIMNLGRSKGKYLQYNAQNSPTLFGCYPDESQTPICIYRRVEAKGDVQDIVAPMVNFGNQVLKDEIYTGSCTVLVNANKLTEDIQVTLVKGDIFHLSATTIDRDGDLLTLTCMATQAGHYRDTLVLQANGIQKKVLVMLNLEKQCTIQEVKNKEDYSSAYLGEVVVTKKYDTYIFVRDSTGSMLIYDNGDGKGGRYGQGLENGHVLTYSAGRYQNYFGVPELVPTQSFEIAAKKVSCEPEEVQHIDSCDVCRFVRLRNLIVLNGSTTVDGVTVAVEDQFQIGITTNKAMDMDAIVYWSHEKLTLWPIKQETPTALECISPYTNPIEKVLLNGVLYIQQGGHLYTPSGTMVQ